MLRFILDLISDCTPIAPPSVDLPVPENNVSWSDRFIDAFTRRQKTKIVIQKNKLVLLSDIVNGNVIQNEYATVTFDLPKFIDTFYTTIIAEIADDIDMFIEMLISIIKSPSDKYDLFTSMHNLYPMTDADNIRLLNAAVSVENKKIIVYLMPIACVTKQGDLNVFDFGTNDEVREMFREYISGINYLTPEATVMFNEQFHGTQTEADSESDTEPETPEQDTETLQDILLARVEYMEKLIASLANDARLV